MVQMPGFWSRDHYRRGEVRLPGSLSFTPDPWDRCLSLKISKSEGAIPTDLLQPSSDPGTNQTYGNTL